MNKYIIVCFAIILSIIMPSLVSSSCIIEFDWAGEQKKILKNIKKHEQDKSHFIYDFIVAGAGSAGSTLVATLLKNKPDLRILLIDVGRHVDNPLVCDYKSFSKLVSTKYYYVYSSVAQKNQQNKVLYMPVGRGLGGGSLVNWMMWVRGHPNDYNAWAKMVKDKTWNYENLLPIFKELENYSTPSNITQCNEPALMESCQRGSNGDIYVSTNIGATKVVKETIEIIAKSGYAYNCDYNSFSNYGTAVAQLNAKAYDAKNPTAGGERQDPFSTQVRRFVGKGHLDILTETKVVKVSLDKSNKVDYVVFTNKGVTYKVRARYETILSSGTFESPAILLRSGIGDFKDLKKVGVKGRVNLKGVGKNLQDHVLLVIPRKLANNKTLYENLVTQAFFGSIDIGNLNLPRPQVQLGLYNNVDPVVGTQGIGYGIVLLHEFSRGTVKLNKANKNGDPLVDFNFFSNKSDYDQFIKAFNMVLGIDVAMQKAGLLEPYNFSTNLTELLYYLNTFATTDSHVTSTCKMGLKSDPMAVVDSRLRVFGVDGLRVCDASIMPEITSGNTNLPAILIGAKCGQFILDKNF